MSAKLISWHTSAIIRRRESFQLQLDLSQSARVHVAHELILQLWNGQAAYCLYSVKACRLLNLHSAGFRFKFGQSMGMMTESEVVKLRAAHGRSKLCTMQCVHVQCELAILEAVASPDE